MQWKLARRKALATIVWVATVSVAGCTQSENGAGPESDSTLQSQTPTETKTDAQPPTMDEIAYSTIEIRDSQILKDGLSAGSDRHQHVVLLEPEAETDRFESEQLDSEVEKFVSETNSETENLLAIQVTLPSGSTEYEVEGVGIRDGQVHVRTSYVNNPGPQNEVLETELVRFAAPSDRSATGVVVHAENYPYADQTQTTFTPSN